jgi:predicted nucleic acid-binding protein
MRLFIDTDILLDVLLKRDVHFDASTQVLDWAEAHPGQCAVSWHSLANIHYLSTNRARDFISELTDFCVISDAGIAEMRRALALQFRDLVDALQSSVALLFKAQVIVIRNVSDYKRSPVKAQSPSDLLPVLRW